MLHICKIQVQFILSFQKQWLSQFGRVKLLRQRSLQKPLATRHRHHRLMADHVLPEKDSGCLVRGTVCSRSKQEFWQIACRSPWNSSLASPSRSLIRSEAITARSHPVKLLFSQPAPTLPLSGGVRVATHRGMKRRSPGDDNQHGEAWAEGF